MQKKAPNYSFTPLVEILKINIVRSIVRSFEGGKIKKLNTVSRRTVMTDVNVFATNRLRHAHRSHADS